MGEPKERVGGSRPSTLSSRSKVWSGGRNGTVNVGGSSQGDLRRGILSRATVYRSLGSGGRRLHCPRRHRVTDQSVPE